MDNILITGHSGFVGTVAQTIYSNTITMTSNKNELIDITNFNATFNFFKENIARFDKVIHLAAISHIGDSFKDPKPVFEVNTHGTYNILKSLTELNYKGSFLFVSTGDIYGAQQGSINETMAPRPQNPYAISKLAAEGFCNQFYKLKDSLFKIIIARPFNHTGVGQTTNFVIPSLINQVHNAIREGKNEIQTGNLETSRDFLNVKDVLNAYLFLLQNGSDGEIYNIASGNSIKISNLLKHIILQYNADLKHSVDPSKLRPTDNPKVSVDITKIKKLGWEPKESILSTINEMIQAKE